MKGGAEKQSVLLANSLSKEYNVYFIVFLGDHMDPHLLNLLSIEKIWLIKLKRNYIGVLFDIYKILLHCDEYEKIPKNYNGEMFLEITTRSFDIKISILSEKLFSLRFFNAL